MRRVYILIVMVLVMSLTPTSSTKAQGGFYDFGGTVLNNDIATWTDLYDLSFTSHNFGTARSMAMGNAFTALGADMVSASLNPAGVGMYLSGDVSFTPMISVAKSNTTGQSYYDVAKTADNRMTRFVVPNFGVVVPVSMSTGWLTNANFAVSYNRVADFNQKRLMGSLDHSYTNSLANYFATFSKEFSGDLNFDSSGGLTYGDPSKWDPFTWGAVLADNTGLISRNGDIWENKTIGSDAFVDQYSTIETLGAVDEWSFAGGFNIVDKVYFGIAIGIQNIDYTRNIYYGEGYRYGNEANDSGLVDQLLSTDYWQSTYFYGTGHNFKFGVTARPVHWLRVGLAYHTPTFYSLEISYAGAMKTITSRIEPGKEEQIIENDAETPYFEEYGINSWRFRTPSRLLTGVAVTLGKRAIISADYERSWYQTIRLQESTIYGLDDIYKGNFKDVFKGSSTLRLGVEYYALPALALRAGYIWSGSGIKDEYKFGLTSRTLPTEQSFLTAGLGLHLSKTAYLDFAYQYGTAHYTSIQPFYVTETMGGVTEPYIDSAIFDTKTTNQNFILTLGFRF